MSIPLTTVRRLLAISGLAFAAMTMASSAAATTLMMPDRDALKGPGPGTDVVVWGNTTLAAGTPFTLDCGNGTPVVNGNVVTPYYIATVCNYPTSGVFTAKLNVTGDPQATSFVSVFDAALLGANLFGIQINLAIQDGLRWLYVNQDNKTVGTLQTSWASDKGALAPIMAYTSLAVLAFENHGFNLAAPAAGGTTIYKDLVQRGLNFIFDNLGTQTLTSGQATGLADPCAGPGIGPAPCIGLGEIAGPPQGYASAIAALAVAGSGVPAFTVNPLLGSQSGGFVANKSYAEISQRQIDLLAWAQADAPSLNEGGWRYALNDQDHDASVMGWDILAMLDGAQFGDVLPSFVATELAKIVAATSCTEAAGELTLSYNVHSSGGACGGPFPDFILTYSHAGVMLQALKFMGVPAGDSRVTQTLTYLNNHWVTGEAGPNKYGCSADPSVTPDPNKGCAYDMFQVFKGLKLYGFTTLSNANFSGDWHKDYQDYLRTNQVAPTTTAGGQWMAPSMHWSCCDEDIRGITALAELILAPTALILPANLTLSPLTATNPVNTTHTVTAHATNAGGGAVPGVTVTFVILSGPNSGSPVVCSETGLNTNVTDNNGDAKCTYSDAGGAGTDTIRANIASLQSNTVTKTWASAITGPFFVIGDVEAHGVGTTVNFWGAQWWKNNVMSGPVSNGVASFKGFAPQSGITCGGTWSSSPGNSSDPPATIPDPVIVIVTDRVVKNGNNISGTIKQMLQVHPNPGYSGNPGHAGSGPVVSVICSIP